MIQHYEETHEDFSHAGIDLFLGSPYQGRGLGTDAVRTMARHLIEDRGHHRLVIDPAAPTAPRSTSRCRRCGACTSTGSRPERPRRERPPPAPRSSSSSRLFRTLATGEPIRESFVTLHHPPFWHYDVLQALVVLARMGLAGDPRAADGLELLQDRRLPDGRWRPGGRWWKPPGKAGSNIEVVDWGTGPSEPLTLNALRVLRAAAA